MVHSSHLGPCLAPAAAEVEAVSSVVPIRVADADDAVSCDEEEDDDDDEAEAAAAETVRREVSLGEAGANEPARSANNDNGIHNQWSMNMTWRIAHS